jgi:hypothetical protein
MKRVIIVGGGYAGASLARALDKLADACVVEARDHFVHNVAAIRSVVDPSLLTRIVIPYDRLLRRGRVRQGVVANAFDGGVTLVNGETIEGDLVIVATGSSYASPFKPAANFVQAFEDSVIAAHTSLLDADPVAIVGGGAVGVELAGEIATAYPLKHVRLVSGAPALMPGYSAKFAQSLEAQLRDMGVDLHLATRVETLEATESPYIGGLSCISDAPADQLVFPALGAQPVNRRIPRDARGPLRRTRPRQGRRVATAGGRAPPVCTWRCRCHWRSDDDRRNHPPGAVACEGRGGHACRRVARIPARLCAMVLARHSGAARPVRRCERAASRTPRRAGR